MLSSNRKALAVGAALFVAGQVMAAVLVAQAGDSSGGGLLANGIWLLLQFSSYLVAVVAGAVAAHLSVDKPIGIGVLAVLIGTAVFLLPAIATGLQDIASAIISPVMFAFFSWLGAILGAYTRIKGGT